MKGLFIKDIKLLKNQKVFILFLLAMLLVGFLDSNAIFMFSYFAILFPMTVLGTISYDQFDNGYAFLFTLPISRKEYVVEKYLLVLISEFTAVFLAGTIAVIKAAFGGTEGIFDNLAYYVFILSVALIYNALMLPLQLKFDSEKARVVKILLMAVVFAICTALGELRVFDATQTPRFMEAGLIITAAVITAVFFLISMKISVAIMNKKEF